MASWGITAFFVATAVCLALFFVVKFAMRNRLSFARYTLASLTFYWFLMPAISCIVYWLTLLPVWAACIGGGLLSAALGIYWYKKAFVPHNPWRRYLPLVLPVFVSLLTFILSMQITSLVPYLVTNLQFILVDLYGTPLGGEPTAVLYLFRAVIHLPFLLAILVGDAIRALRS